MALALWQDCNGNATSVAWIVPTSLSAHCVVLGASKAPYLSQSCLSYTSTVLSRLLDHFITLPLESALVWRPFISVECQILSLTPPTHTHLSPVPVATDLFTCSTYLWVPYLCHENKSKQIKRITQSQQLVWFYEIYNACSFLGGKKLIRNIVKHDYYKNEMWGGLSRVFANPQQSELKSQPAFFLMQALFSL